MHTIRGERRGGDAVEQCWNLEGGGTLRMQEDGLWVRLNAACTRPEPGLYKVWLLGEPGGETLLGTLEPEQGQLCLQRTLSRSSLAAQACWPLAGGTVVRAGEPTQREDWRRVNPAQVKLSDPVLLRCLRRTEKIWFRTRPHGFQLAEPFDPTQPLVLVPLFCLGRIGTVQGNPAVIWEFSCEGVPQVPEPAL